MLPLLLLSEDEDVNFDGNISESDWIEQCFTSPPTQYRLYGRRFLQV